MYYEIIVSLKGVHYFATHKRSITSGKALKAIYNDFKTRFPEGDGFEVYATKYVEAGHHLLDNEINSL